MHDLNTIHRLNEEAHGKAVRQWQYEGRWVLAVYAGVHLLRAEPYGTHAEAQAALTALTGGPDWTATDRATVLAPTQDGYTPRRDQSEDRLTLADLTKAGAAGLSDDGYLAVKQRELDKWAAARDAIGAV
jgi:hypothetical protein